MTDARQPGVYLAGPTVFEPDPAAIFTVMKAICARHGLRGVAPLDNQLDLRGEPPGPALVQRIVAADIALMRAADAGIFCLDGFRRGPEMDPGTAFEVGFMAALGKPLMGWTRDPRPYPDRVADYFAQNFGLALHAGTATGPGAISGARRDPDGQLVHSEGCYQNAMIHVGIELTGAIHADAVWQTAFERAIAQLSKQLVV